MSAIIGLLGLILGVVYFIILVHLIMSWLINFDILNTHQQFVGQIWEGLNRLVEPIYQPIRNILPNTHPLDLAPLVVLILVIWLRSYVLPMLAGAV